MSQGIADARPEPRSAKLPQSPGIGLALTRAKRELWRTSLRASKVESMSAQLAIPDGTGLSPGYVVGNKYRIDGCLGEGGMGVVLSATHLELDAPVAIKVVREEFANSQDIVERVLFEARLV